MSYNKTTWVDGETPLSAQNMNKIENQIEQNTNDIAGIIESGSNTNGEWVKYSDGTMICTKKITFTNVVINTAWGSVYESASKFNFGDYAQEFIEIPNVSITLADGSTCFCESFSGRTKTAIGNTWLWKPAVEAKGTMTFDVIAIGRWK